MNTTVDELKALYVELGGSAADVVDIVTIPDMIAELANVAGSTIELPAVSASDNGDVLTVVSGKWAKADIPAELPAVTAADNGKVLGVANGAWGAVNVPSDVVVIHGDAGNNISGSSPTHPYKNVVFTIDESNHQSLISGAITAKKPVILVIRYGSGYQQQLQLCDYNSSGYAFCGHSMGGYSNDLITWKAMVSYMASECKINTYKQTLSQS